MKKQMGYANKRNVPFVVLAGTSEMNNNSFTVKDMQTGTQKEMNLKELTTLLR
jgi:histidyl-tRNA synthetase